MIGVQAVDQLQSNVTVTMTEPHVHEAFISQQRLASPLRGLVDGLPQMSNFHSHPGRGADASSHQGRSQAGGINRHLQVRSVTDFHHIAGSCHASESLTNTATPRAVTV
jgi:hypothetical protein